MLPIFDEPELLDRLGDDLELLDEVVGVFLEDAPVRMQAIADAVLHASATELRAAAHAIKGAAASLGAARLAESAHQLEQRAAAGQMAAESQQRVSADMHELMSVLRRRASAA